MSQLVELKEAEEKSLKESERLEKEIAEVQELKVRQNISVVLSICAPVSSISISDGLVHGGQRKISTMTADEYFEKHPEVKKKFDDEIRNDNWGY